MEVARVYTKRSRPVHTIIEADSRTQINQPGITRNITRTRWPMWYCLRFRLVLVVYTNLKPFTHDQRFDDCFWTFHSQFTMRRRLLRRLTYVLPVPILVSKTKTWRIRDFVERPKTVFSLVCHCYPRNENKTHTTGPKLFKNA